jgi:hypothetical protein
MNLSDQGGERRFLLAGSLLVAIVTLLFVWWGLKEGAYFSPVFYPGELAVLGLLAIVLIGVPLRMRLRGPALVALLALIVLGGWALLSILWTPTQNVALVDTHKIIVYASLFGIGLWLASLLGERRDLTLLAVGVGVAVVGVVATIVFGFGTDPLKFLDEDGTLLYPIGYRNADAAFWLIGAWPLLILAVRSKIVWPLRASLLAAVTMLVELAILCQSRGSLPAAAISLVVVALLSRQALKTAIFALVAAVPVIPATPTLLKVFQHGSADAGSIPLLHHSAVAIALSTLGSFALAAIVLGVGERNIDVAPRTVRRVTWIGGGAVAVAVLFGVVAYVGHEGGPVKFVDQRAEELNEGNPDLRSQGARFGTNIASNRGDVWRVALDEWKEDPVRGGGAGSWQVKYLHDKTVYTPAEDPHSVEMLMLSEFGLPGFIACFTFLVAAVMAALRARRIGPASVTLAAGALAAASQWLVQASYDWLFFYPGVTAPVIFLLGAAAAPAVREGAERLRAVRLAVCLVVVLVVAVAAGALSLSSRYTDRAANEWRTNLGAAYADFDDAASLDPFAVEPLLSKGAVAREVGDIKTAVKSFDEVLERQPDNFSAYYLLGLTLARSQPRVALQEFSKAHELNPLFFLAADVRCAKARVRGRGEAKDACRAQ